MELTYEQLAKTVNKDGPQAGVELVVYALLASNKVKLTDKGKQEFSAFLTEYVEKYYGFTPEMLILFGMRKQEWLMELIREAMLSDEMAEKMGINMEQ